MYLFRIIKRWVTCFVREAWHFLNWFYMFLRTEKTETYSNQDAQVVVIGNGPSAAKFPYQEYIEKGYDLCCVNWYAINEERFFELKPKFYCCIDPLFGDEEHQKTQKSRDLVAMLERVDWEMYFITYKHKHLNFHNDRIKLHYVNRRYYSGEYNKFRKFLFDRNMANGGFQNVIVGCLYYFIMSKAKHIVLTGVENDWHRELSVGEDCDIYREYVHFYGTELVNITKAGHIKKGELFKYFLWYSMTLEQYACMAKYAQDAQVCIENSCIKSYIDAFPKIHI